MNKLKLSILLNALLVPLGAAFGQSQVSEIPSMVSDTTIVRYWQEDVSVVYTCNSSTADKYFMSVEQIPFSICVDSPFVTEDEPLEPICNIE